MVIGTSVFSMVIGTSVFTMVIGTSVFTMVIGTSVFSKVVTSHATCTSTCARSIEQDSGHAALGFRQEHASLFTILKQQRLTLVLRTCTCMTNRTRLLGFRDERVNLERYKSNITFSLVNMGEYSLVMQTPASPRFVYV